MPRINLIISGESAQPYKLPVERELTTIGRDSSNDIVIDSSSASSKHCVMKRVTGGFILEDLDSTNGLKVDGTLHSSIKLNEGITVYIGADAVLEISFGEDELLKFQEEIAQSQILQEAPAKPATPAAPQLKPQYQPKKNEPSVFLFLFLAILALLGGIAFRHYQNITAANKAATEETQSAE